MNDTIERLLEPLDHLDPGDVPDIAARRPAPRSRRRQLALAGAGALAAASVFALPVVLQRGSDSPPSLVDVVLGARQANALPDNASDLVLFQRIDATADATLVCEGGVVTGDPRLDGGVVTETWTHGASGRERTVLVDEQQAYDFVKTIVEEPAPGRMIVDVEGDVPDPSGERGCLQEDVVDIDAPFAGWEGPEQEGIVATLRSSAALGLTALGDDATDEQRADLFAALGDAPGATVLAEPAVDRLGRAVVSVQVEIANSGQRYVGTWRFDPDTFEIREIVEYEENAMIVGTSTQTIVDRAWMPFSESVFDLAVPPPAG